jgi:regulator of cell morphogenesis and NO signaling
MPVLMREISNSLTRREAPSMPIERRRAVGDLVAERISRAAVLDRYGIDYCCHGSTPLDEACRRLGLGLEQVVDEIELSDAMPRQAGEPDCSTTPLGQLADQIETTHHVFMRRELPRLQALLAKVIAAHGDRHPELSEVAVVFSAFCEEIDSHMMKEERVLFPMIRELETASSLPSFHCGSVKNPIRVMEHEHDSAGAALSRMRVLTGSFVTPADGCASYQTLMERLAQVEADLHLHIHKENNILFPKAASLEAGLALR